MIHLGRYRMLLQKGFAFTVSEAEEHHIYLPKRHGCRKPQVGVAIKTFMHIGHEIAGIAL